MSTVQTVNVIISMAVVSKQAVYHQIDLSATLVRLQPCHHSTASLSNSIPLSQFTETPQPSKI